MSVPGRVLSFKFHYLRPDWETGVANTVCLASFVARGWRKTERNVESVETIFTTVVELSTSKSLTRSSIIRTLSALDALFAASAGTLSLRSSPKCPTVASCASNASSRRETSPPAPTVAHHSQGKSGNTSALRVPPVSTVTPFSRKF